VRVEWSHERPQANHATRSDNRDQAAERAGTDLALVSVEDRAPRPLLQTEFAERNVTLSPDGRWYAFDSNKASTSSDAIYVRPFPAGSREIRISPGEGTYPQWRANGREIFCISNRDLMVVSVAPGDPPRFGSPVKLYTGLR
jgi:Tol biopolymer transport system component